MKKIIIGHKKEVFANWVESYTDTLFRHAYQKTNSNETAEDLVQETFLAAYEGFDAFKGDSSPKTWLYAILKYKIIAHYRKSIKQPHTSGNEIYLKNFTNEGDWLDNQLFKNQKIDEENLLDNQLFLKTLKKCLSHLPEPWRLAVQLKYFSLKKSAEICKELDISSSNYWQIIHRAKLQLKNCIDINWFNQQ